MRPFRPSLFLPARHPISAFSRSRLHVAARRPYRSTGPSREIRIRRPWLSWRTVATWTFYGTVTYVSVRFLLNKLLDGVEFEFEEVPIAQADTKKQDGGSKAEQEDEYETVVMEHVEGEEPIFLPLQYPKELPKRFYKSSDPEWELFGALSKDHDLQQGVKNELAKKLATTAAALPPFRQRLGHGIKPTRIWLDFTYPEGPPPEYTRKGIVVLDDGFAIAQQLIPHSQYVQIQSVMWPTAIFGAAKTSLEVLWRLQSIKFKKIMGTELSDKEKHVDLASKLFNMRQNAADKMQEHIDTQDRLHKDKADKLGASSAQEGQDAPADDSRRLLFGLPPPKVPVVSDLSISSRVFMGSVITNWTRAKRDELPAGCCFLAGDVELLGSRGRVKMDVAAAYDPKTNELVWVTSKPKQFWELTQKPKGDL